MTSDVVATARMRVLTRDLAWLGDSTPAIRFNPPYIYGAWRLEIEQCSGLERDGWPKLYVAPVNPLNLSNVGRAAIYVEESHSIVFALGEESVKPTVLHELLHWLLALHVPPPPPGETATAREIRTHPEDYFAGRCAETLRGLS